MALQAGHVISNEPGYYADGKWGIRIENIIVTKPAELRNNFGDKGYLQFEHVTMVCLCHSRVYNRPSCLMIQCPMQTRLVDVDLLSPDERKWLNDYHAEVKEKVTPLLTEFKDERALAWLEQECKPI